MLTVNSCVLGTLKYVQQFYLVLCLVLNSHSATHTAVVRFDLSSSVGSLRNSSMVNCPSTSTGERQRKTDLIVYLAKYNYSYKFSLECIKYGIILWQLCTISA